MSITFPDNINCYLVGGAVRDELLGISQADRDFLVTGATPEIMKQLGFEQVGKDFPVFLHPQTHEEYALARTERKSGNGYTGFVTNFSADITVEEDLSRRDLTINAMARDVNGELIDPYHGLDDLKRRILRHVSPAFVEDPLRVLRVARFAARFPEFCIAEETIELMQQLSQSGELETLVAERVWQETQKALTEKQPSRFFEVLQLCGALPTLFPELHQMIAIPQRADFHAEGDVWNHTLLVLEKARNLAITEKLNSQDTLSLMAAALWHDVGKAVTPRELLYDEQGNMLGRHHGHDSEKQVMPILEAVFKRLPLPKTLMQLIKDTALLHIRIHRLKEMKTTKQASFFEENSFHNKGGEQYLRLLGLVCKADSMGRLLTVDGEIVPAGEDYAPLSYLLKAYALFKAIPIGEWIATYRRENKATPSAEQIKQQKHQMAAKALKTLT